MSNGRTRKESVCSRNTRTGKKQPIIHVRLHLTSAGWSPRDCKGLHVGRRQCLIFPSLSSLFSPSYSSPFPSTYLLLNWIYEHKYKLSKLLKLSLNLICRQGLPQTWELLASALLCWGWRPAPHTWGMFLLDPTADSVDVGSLKFHIAMWLCVMSVLLHASQESFTSSKQLVRQGADFV